MSGPPQKEGRISTISKVVGIVAGLATLLNLGFLANTFLDNRAARSPAGRIAAEEQIVAKLSAGMPFATMVDILGQGPNATDRSRIRWDREWEFIVATLDGNRDAYSIGIFVTDRSFRPTRFSGWDIEIGEPLASFSHAVGEPSATYETCGSANRSAYLEIYDSSTASDNQSLAVGAVNLDLDRTYKVDNACGLAMELSGCDPFSDCVKKLTEADKLEEFRNRLKSSAIVVADSGKGPDLTAESITLPDEVR